MKQSPEKMILYSWRKNISPWIRAIRGQEIESRLLVTNRVIVDTVTGASPKKVADIGCGEGWLVRELVRDGIDCLGIDAMQEFVDFARNEGEGRYVALSYDQLSPETIGETFDVLVCNFSLFGNESVSEFFRIAPSLLNSRGSLIVQTLHPGVEGKPDGWTEGSWCGFNAEFCEPAPWYYRSMDSWKALFSNAGFESLEIREPSNPRTSLPASAVFVGKLCS